jgi:hypothetical protein
VEGAKLDVIEGKALTEALVAAGYEHVHCLSWNMKSVTI